MMKVTELLEWAWLVGVSKRGEWEFQTQLLCKMTRSKTHDLKKVETFYVM
jgi:hypothetical protein